MSPKQQDVDGLARGIFMVNYYYCQQTILTTEDVRHSLSRTKVDNSKGITKCVMGTHVNGGKVEMFMFRSIEAVG